MPLKLKALLIVMLFFVSCDNQNNKASTYIDTSIDTSGMIVKAESYILGKEYFKSQLIYDSLIVIDSTNPEYYFKRGYVKSLLLYNDEGAIDDYLKSIFYGYYNKQSAYYNIGILYSLNEQYDSALYYIEECLKIEPKNEKAKLQRTIVREELNDFN